MAFELKPLEFDYAALEPYIDEQTMRIHHDKHHQTYVTNLNAALEKHPEVNATSVVELLSNLDKVPEDIRSAVKNNGGGHYHHKLFWHFITPGGAKEPGGALASEIEKTFGGIEDFKTKFNTGGLTRFGSGWVWLAADATKKLVITSTANQDSVLAEGLTPLLGNDVWEHAYYLKYQNRRADYLSAWWNVVNWDVVAERYKSLK